jgi:hypothetical protein
MRLECPQQLSHDMGSDEVVGSVALALNNPCDLIQVEALGRIKVDALVAGSRGRHVHNLEAQTNCCRLDISLKAKPIHFLPSAQLSFDR